MKINLAAAAATLALAAGTVAAANAQTATTAAPAQPQRPNAVTISMQRVALPAPAGPYDGRAFISQCGNQSVVGPLPTPVPGSAAAQPLYQWYQDFDRIGAACRAKF